MTNIARIPALSAIFMLAACGANPPAIDHGAPTDSPSGTADTPPPTPTAAPKVDKPDPPKDPGAAGGLTEDQRAQLEIALRRGGDKAAQCLSVVPDAPRGEGEVRVTFDGKKGRATDAVVGPPWAGTPVEACIKRSFTGEIVVPFDGSLEVPYTVKIGKGDDKGKGKTPPPKGKK